MKRIMIGLGLTVTLSLISESPLAKPKKSWRGYWVVQDHVKGKEEAIVKFYNDSDSLVFQQSLGNKRIELNKKNIKRLNKELKNFGKSEETKKKFVITKL